MVDTATWRARIGSWAGKSRRAHEVRSVVISENVLCNLLCVSVLAVLLVIGGIETNPGPTTDEKLDAIMAKVNKLDSVEENVLLIKNQMSTMETKILLMQTKINDMETIIESLSSENSVLAQKIEVMARKEDYLENQSRRNNLVFRGLSEKQGGNESWKDCEDLIIDTTRRLLGVKVEANDIERAHRVAGGKFPRAIVVKFLSFKIREEVFRRKKNLKGSDIVISEDFSQRVIEDRRILLAEMVHARQDHHDAIVTFDKLKVNGIVYRVDENTKQIVRAYDEKPRGPRRVPTPSSMPTPTLKPPTPPRMGPPLQPSSQDHHQWLRHQQWLYQQHQHQELQHQQQQQLPNNIGNATSKGRDLQGQPERPPQPTPNRQPRQAPLSKSNETIDYQPRKSERIRGVGPSDRTMPSTDVMEQVS